MPYRLRAVVSPSRTRVTTRAADVSSTPVAAASPMLAFTARCVSSSVFPRAMNWPWRLMINSSPKVVASWMLPANSFIRRKPSWVKRPWTSSAVASFLSACSCWFAASTASLAMSSAWEATALTAPQAFPTTSRD